MRNQRGLVAGLGNDPQVDGQEPIITHGMRERVNLLGGPLANSCVMWTVLALVALWSLVWIECLISGTLGDALP